MIYFEVKDKSNDKIVATNLDTCSDEVLALFKGKESENITIGRARNAVRNNKAKEVRLVLVDEEISAGNKGITRIADVILNLVPTFHRMEQRFKQHSDTIISRFAHNLVDIDKKLKGHLEQLAPDTVRDREFEKFVDEVEQRIKANPRAAAAVICEISHRATDLEAQIAGLRVMSGLAEKFGPSLVDVKISRAIYRLTQISIPELAKKKVEIKNKIDGTEAAVHRVRVDPQLLNVALSQFFDNAVKYTLPGSEIVITASFGEKTCEISIHMVSLVIEPHEVRKIFQERYKGEHAKKLDGSGIGMFTTKRALQIMKGDITVEPSVGTEVSVDDKKYAVNVFKITLPSKKLNGN